MSLRFLTFTAVSHFFLVVLRIIRATHYPFVRNNRIKHVIKEHVSSLFCYNNIAQQGLQGILFFEVTFVSRILFLKIRGNNLTCMVKSPYASWFIVAVSQADFPIKASEFW